MKCIQKKPNGLVLSLVVLPRSSKTMVAGFHGDAVKIKLTAPPVDNAANDMCIDYLSKSLSLPKSSFEILSGKTGRKKNILIRCLTDRDCETVMESIRHWMKPYL